MNARLLLVVLAAALAVDGFAGDRRPAAEGSSARRQARTTSIGPSPHGKADACESCHAAAEAPAKVGAALPIVPTCLKCHPDADMHPVGIKPDQIKIPKGWPLEDGLLTCATCHAEPAHAGQKKLEPPYHREGPYPVVLDLCYRCHTRSDYKRADPHHPEARRDPGSPTCAACHSGLPLDGAPPAEAKLRVAPREVCLTCHENFVHGGQDAHMGAEVPAARRDALPPTVAVDADGRISCWSCHEVHGDGTDVQGRHPSKLAQGLKERALEHEWADVPDLEARWPGIVGKDEHPRMLALPIEDGSLCRACHGSGP